MALIRLRNIQLGFGGPPILENLELSVDAGERLCLLGRNGAGKSTLLKVIAGKVKADSGEIESRQSMKMAMLDQEPRSDVTGSIFDVVASGLGDSAILLQDYHHALHRLETDCSEQAMEQLSRAQHKVDAADAWGLNQQVEETLSRMKLDGDIDYPQLSGGMKRRVLLAKALVIKPDILLLDEPTNHLDVAAINWLEQQLIAYNGALIFITHDRAFMRNLSTRIVELDRGRLVNYPCDYDTFLVRKEDMLHAEEVANAEFDKKLAQEEIWIRQGIKARRTRNEGRVRALEKLRSERGARREKTGNVNMEVSTADRSGKVVAEAEGVSFRYEDKDLIRPFNATVLRGDKIAILGPNGVGKTTLLRLLLGELEPTTGHINLGTKLEVAYFDQMRAQLDESLSVFDNISQGRDFIEINGKDKHVFSYLQDFLFAPERARSPVSALSGGERNRLLLARLFSKPSNILVLDEPTNDLDIETLELLEELVMNYAGTVLLVSHDREFVNNVVTSTLVFENITDGSSNVNEYVGGYDDWVRQRPVSSDKGANKASAKAAQGATKGSTKQSNKATEKKSAKKLSYKDQKELDGLPKKIDKIENDISELQNSMAADGFYQQDPAKIKKVQDELQQAENALQACYERWEALEEG